MEKKQHAKNRIQRFLSAALAIFISLTVCLVFVPSFENSRVDAETVTDTLTVKVGYWGMKECDYVTKATYHWTELYENLLVKDDDGNPAYVDYSFFQEREDNSYSTVVASGIGIYLDDLLNYAGVNTSDIEYLSFYTNDYSNGAFASFAASDLLDEPRFYYDNLAGHIKNNYNDAGILIDYTIDEEVEENKTEVRTMLALESNWYRYPAGTQHTDAIHSGLSTSSRFRLLFGQTSAEETGMTKKSAKYVHTVAVTIPGSPVIKGKNTAGNGIVLSNKLGKHRVKFNVAADEAMIDTIKDNLVWSSSDDRVLSIDNISMSQSRQYNDAVEVVIDYTVKQDGADATINGSFLGLELSGSNIETGENPTDDVERPDDDDSGGGASGDTDSTEGNGGNSSGKSSDDNSGGNGSGSDDDKKLSYVAKGDTQNSVNEHSVQQAESATSTAKDAEGQKTAGVDDSANNGEATSGSTLYAMDLDDVMNPKNEKTVIKNVDDTKKYVPGLCLGGGGLLILGGAASALQFKSQTTGFAFRRKKFK